MKSRRQKNADKEFRLSSWAIDHSTIIYVLIAIILLMGISAYFSMPRETFPEVEETKIYVSVPYPGNTAEDIERLIIDPLEEKIKNLSNVVEILSTSQEDYGIITVEFDENIEVEQAKQKVKDEVDSEKASEDWPIFNNAKVEPDVFALNLSEEMPISNINISGDYTVEKLKEYAEYLQDKIEDLPEIKKADIRGAQEKEVEVAVDIYKMMAAKVNFDDVISSIRNGNMTMSAGSLVSSGQNRAIRVLGEIEEPSDLKDFVVKTDKGVVYLGDIADIYFKEEDKTTYAREKGSSVVMLDIKKRSGRNEINAVNKIKDIIKTAKEEALPGDLSVTVTNDQSTKTINNVNDLVNNIIFGILLVVGVLMFFLGFKNSLFVGFAIPMSMFMSFMILSAIGYTLNTMILFGLVMGLGMLVDNGIVVVENVYRLMDEEGMPRVQAAKKGIGEIAFPIIISTATTIAAFIPLGLWPGIMGEFMMYFPITLSVVLGSSLFVAIFMNSMLVSRFMQVVEKEKNNKGLIRVSATLMFMGVLIYILGGNARGLGTLLAVIAIMLWVYKYFLKGAAEYFQNNILSRIEGKYQQFLKYALKGRKPYLFVAGIFLLLIMVFMGFGMSVASLRTNVEFFPDNKPNQIIIYIEYPQGTEIEKTNAITKDIERRVYAILDDDQYKDEDGYNFMVESAVSQVGEGAGNPFTDSGSAAEMPHRAKIIASMREFKYRKGKDSEVMRGKIQNVLKDVYPGLAISVEKDPVGPPVGYPINIEIEGESYDELIQIAERMRNFINSKNIAGVEELKIDVNKGKPSMNVMVDRKKAGELGVAVGQVGNQLRRSVFGEKAGIYKKDGEDYDINVRFNEDIKHNKSALFDQNIIFKDQNTGEIKEVPISAVTRQINTSSFSSIKHRDTKRVVTVYSGLQPGYTDAAAIVGKIQAEMEGFDNLPKDISIDYTGQIEEQNKEQAFLNGALMSGLGLIMLILIFQFSSISKPTIIMIAILLSLIGVFGGILITGASFVIMMTMMGIISLAGIVVNNGVVLLDYTQILIDRKMVANNMSDDELLSKEEIKETIVQAGRARLRPVLLTAITTVLGLFPLAIGLNIDFFSLFSDFNPKIFIGGDNVIFWGPLAWTVIYGLIIATFLTLVIVPILFYLVHRIKLWIRKINKNKTSELEEILAE
jgi:multidrug efflux pump subunit AcrB